MWSPADDLNFPERFNPIAAIDTTTVFVVTGTNSFGCYAKDSVQVKVTRENIPVNPVPNAFTPNNDGKNDCFGISK